MLPAGTGRGGSRSGQGTRRSSALVKAVGVEDEEKVRFFDTDGFRPKGEARIGPMYNDHIILTEIISNDPQGPVTRCGDERWQLVVRWVLNGTIAAEALGVTSKNVEEMKAKSASSEVRRLLGAEGKFGQMMGLSDDWMFNAIKQVGNYGESYERTVGMGSALKLKRGANELWTKGGLLYSPPFQ